MIRKAILPFPAFVNGTKLTAEAINVQFVPTVAGDFFGAVEGAE